MKNYADYAKSSISMSKDDKFIKTLDEIFERNLIKNIVESGTFKGTGSTTTIAESIIRTNSSINKFYTLEVDKKFHKIAVKNLKKFNFIKPIWGISVSPKEAVDFINNDDAIINHIKYPDIFIDTIENPKDFYINEINGQLSKITEKRNFFSNLFSVKNDNETFQENVFDHLLPNLINETPLILLDSAGGIGFFEFKTVLKHLMNSPFIIILDDVNHLKHFRSLNYIRESNNFKILNESIEDGWIIAEHKI